MLVVVRHMAVFAYILAHCFLAFPISGVSNNLDLYVVLYDFVTWPEAHLETATDFHFHRQIILKNFLQKVKDGLGVNLAMSKCDGYKLDKDAKDRAKEHLYFVDGRVSSRVEHMIDSFVVTASPEALLECLDDASDYIFDEIHGGARSDAKRVLLIIHRPMPIVLNATFYDKMRFLKSKFNLRILLAVNDYQRDNLTMETFTKKMAEHLKIDQMILFDGREDSARNFISQFWSALTNPSVEQVPRKAIDCIVGYETSKLIGRQDKCTCLSSAIILQHPSADGRPCPSSLKNRTRKCNCSTPLSGRSKNEPFLDSSVEAVVEEELESDSSRTFLIVALILAFLVITSVGFLSYLMHKRYLAQTVKTKKPEATSKARASMQSLSLISIDASPSTTTAKSKKGSKQVMVKVKSPSQSQKSAADIKVNSMSETLFSTTSSLPTKSKRTVKDHNMSKKNTLSGKKKTLYPKTSVRSQISSIGQQGKKLSGYKANPSTDSGAGVSLVRKSIKVLGQK